MPPKRGRGRTAAPVAPKAQKEVILLDSSSASEDETAMLNALKSKRVQQSVMHSSTTSALARIKGRKRQSLALDSEDDPSTQDLNGNSSHESPASGITRATVEDLTPAPNEQPPPRPGPRKKKKAQTGGVSGSLDDFFDMGGSGPSSGKKKRPRHPDPQEQDDDDLDNEDLTGSTHKKRSRKKLAEELEIESWKPMPTVQPLPLLGDKENSTSVIELDDSSVSEVGPSKDPVQEERETSMTPPPPTLSYTERTSNLEERIGQHLKELERAKTSIQSDQFDLEKIKKASSLSDLSAASTKSHPETSCASILDIIVEHRKGPDFSQPCSTVMFKMTDSQPFREMIAQIASMQKVSSSDIIIACQGVRLFPSTTPGSLGLNKQIQLNSFLASEFDAYLEYMGKLREKALEGGFSEDEDNLESTEQVESGLVGIKLKEKSGEVLKIKVSLTSTIQELITKLAQLKSTPAKNIRLKFDGETLELGETLEELDVEDGDTLELVIR